MKHDDSVEREIFQEEIQEEEKGKTGFFSKKSTKETSSSSNKSLIQKIGIKNLCIILALGFALIFIVYQESATTKKDGKDASKASSNITDSLDSNPIYAETKSETEDYVVNQEKRLKEILEKVEGVGKVEVRIRLAESKELVTLKDAPYTHDSMNEDDGEGGSRESMTITQEDETVMSTTESGEMAPYIIKEIQPTIAGVVVVAEGGGDGVLQLDIVEAVEALYDLPAHKIKVLPMGSKNR